MEDFSAFKYTTIAELFYVIISYHIYTNVYYLVLCGPILPYVPTM